ncbi:hypothetical protein I2483_13815 [Sporosarcina sp. E16_3]|uniref:hypothetical protein n=1 Tax=Sporosarcina sp. E16_3 TaxID=2789293 RepID=UPI001A91FE20|nr:hypothetical protein [Sporosarcina sp. E16_3]MBO0602740.1 hypothetical protein [Sporosarcina sp. E16_3]
MTIKPLKYRPSVHAIERLREYFGTSEIHATDYANELMVGAQFVEMAQKGRRVFKSVVEDVMLVIGEGGVIITVLPPPGKGKNNAYTMHEGRLSDVIKAAVQRELTKARRTFTREYRAITEEIAVIGMEIAQLSLNKARARSPITQKHITDKVALIHARQEELAEDRKALKAEYQRLQDEAKTYAVEA